MLKIRVLYHKGISRLHLSFSLSSSPRQGDLYECYITFLRKPFFRLLISVLAILKLKPQVFLAGYSQDSIITRICSFHEEYDKEHFSLNHFTNQKAPNQTQTWSFHALPLLIHVMEALWQIREWNWAAQIQNPQTCQWPCLWKQTFHIKTKHKTFWK